MALLASDGFNRTNANPIGSPWTTITSTSAYQITSNAAAPTATASDCGSRWTGPTFPNDQWVQGRITMAGTNTGAGPGLVARCASAAETLYMIVANHNGTGSCTLYKAVSGTFTMPWGGNRTVVWADGDLWRLEVRGTTLRVLVNGTPVGADVTDSGVTSGNPGIFSSSTITSGSIDEWCAGDFSGNDYTLIEQQSLNRSYLY